MTERESYVNLLVVTHYGPIVGDVAKALLYEKFITPARIAAITQHPLSLVREALLVLMKNNLVFFGSNGDDQYYFDLDNAAIEARLRISRFVPIAQDTVGASASVAIAQLAHGGSLNVDELLQRTLDFIQSQISSDVSTIPTEEWNECIENLPHLVLDLLRAGFLSLCLPGAKRQPIFRRMQLEAEYRRLHQPEPKRVMPAGRAGTYRAQLSMVQPLAKRDKESIERGLLEKESDWQQSLREEEAGKYVFDKALVGSSNESNYPFENGTNGHNSNGAEPPSKRARVSNGDGPSRPRDQAWVKINMSKFHRLWRDKVVQRYVTKNFNERLGNLFELFLRNWSTSRECDLRDSQTFTLKDAVALVKQGPPEEEAELRLAFQDTPQFDPARVSLDRLVEAAIDVLACADNIDDRSRRQRAVIQRVPSLHVPTYTIPFGDILENLRLQFLEDVIRAYTGRSGLVCWRLLRRHGKMEDRRLATLLILPLNEARKHIDALCAYSFIEIQEIPKTPDRKPERTAFILYTDVHAICDRLMRNFYRGIADLERRRHMQLEANRAITTKAHKNSRLSNGEISLLADLETKCADITVAQLRIDEAIAILKLFQLDN